MSVFARLFHRDAIASAPFPNPEEVLVCLKLSDDGIGTARERQAITSLRDRLIRLVQARQVGDFEELVFDEGYGTVSFSSPSADRLAEALLPALRVEDAERGSYLLKRYGNAGAREQSIVLHPCH